jgi:hypothetical protein
MARRLRYLCRYRVGRDRAYYAAVSRRRVKHRSRGSLRDRSGTRTSLSWCGACFGTTGLIAYCASRGSCLSNLVVRKRPGLPRFRGSRAQAKGTTRCRRNQQPCSDRTRHGSFPRRERTPGPFRASWSVSEIMLGLGSSYLGFVPCLPTIALSA